MKFIKTHVQVQDHNAFCRATFSHQKMLPIFKQDPHDSFYPIVLGGDQHLTGGIFMHSVSFLCDFDRFLLLLMNV